MGLRVFWDGFGLFLGGFWLVWEWFWDVAVHGFGVFLACFVDCLLGSRSQVAEKVEEPEPMRARERTTGRAVWVGLGVFWVGLLDCFCGAGLGWF